MIPAAFEYVRADSVDARHRRAHRARRRGEAAGRRDVAHPADEAAPGDAHRARRRRPPARPLLHPRRRRPRRHRRAHPSPRPRDQRPARAAVPGAAGRGRRGRRQPGPPPRARSAARSRTATPRPTFPPCCSRSTPRSWRSGPGGERTIAGRRLLPGLPRDRARTRRAAHRDPRPEGHRRLELPEVQPASPGLGDRRRGRRAQRLDRASRS